MHAVFINVHLTLAAVWRLSGTYRPCQLIGKNKLSYRPRELSAHSVSRRVLFNGKILLSLSEEKVFLGNVFASRRHIRGRVVECLGYYE